MIMVKIYDVLSWCLSILLVFLILLWFNSNDAIYAGSKEGICYNFNPNSVWYKTYPEELHTYEEELEVISIEEVEDFYMAYVTPIYTRNTQLNFSTSFNGKIYKFSEYQLNTTKELKVGGTIPISITTTNCYGSNKNIRGDFYTLYIDNPKYWIHKGYRD